MSLPPCFATSNERGNAIPLVLLDRASLSGWLTQQPAATGRWARTQAFTAEAGSALLVPDADGAPRCALARVLR